MKITHLNGACELIESNGIKILIDPWLVDGEYYGSWCAYPSLKDFLCITFFISYLCSS